MVMISMIKSTSITSISGVVLMSIISSGSPDPPPLPTFIPMKFSLSRGAGAAHGRFGNEPDLEYAGALACEHHPADEFVACALVGPNMHFWLGMLHRNLRESGQQFLIVDKKLLARLKEIAVKQPQPEVHVRADKSARYEFVGRVVFVCRRAGIIKIGFIRSESTRLNY